MVKVFIAEGIRLFDKGSHVQSLNSFENALCCRELTPEQYAQVSEIIDHIRTYGDLS